MELSPALIQLLKEVSYGQLSTLMPDGAPHITQVWLDTDGEHILVNTVATHQKTRNVKLDARVAINVHDPTRPYRIANIRGRVVEMNVPIATVKVAADVPEAQRSHIEVMRTERPIYQAVVDAARNRGGPWNKFSPGYVDLCSAPIPVKEQ